MLVLVSAPRCATAQTALPPAKQQASDIPWPIYMPPVRAKGSGRNNFRSRPPRRLRDEAGDPSPVTRFALSAANRQVIVLQTATVEVVPDRASIWFKTQHRHADRDTAMAECAKATAALVDRLIAAGVAAGDLSTSRVVVVPERAGRNEFGMPEGQIPGYHAWHDLWLTIREIPRTGHFTRLALRVGATGIESFNFTLSDEQRQRAENEVQRKAVRLAAEAAGLAARSSGNRLGALVRIGPPPPAGGAADLGGAPEEPEDLGPLLTIEPGVIEVTVTIEAAWQLSR